MVPLDLPSLHHSSSFLAFLNLEQEDFSQEDSLYQPQIRLDSTDSIL